MAGEVLIKIGANAGQAIGEINKVTGALGNQMSASKKASNVTRKAAVPAALALLALAGAAIDCAKAAAEDEAAQVKLAGQLQRVTKATDAAISSAEDYISKLSLATGVADDELRPALAKLATATGDLSEAQTGLTVAVDVSAASGKSLEAVSKALAKAYAGSGGALAKLMPGLNEAAIKSGDLTKINAELARVTGGAAAEAAGTSAGQFRIFNLQVEELKETLGASLLPILNELAPKLNQIAAYVNANTKTIEIAVVAVASIAAAIIALNAAISAWTGLLAAFKIAQVIATAAVAVFNLVVAGNPIALIVIGIAAFVAGLILLYRNSADFRVIVDQLYAALRQLGAQGLAFVRDHMDDIKAALNAVKIAAVAVAVQFLPGGFLYDGIATIQEKTQVFTRIVDGARIAYNLTAYAVTEWVAALRELIRVTPIAYAAVSLGIRTVLDPVTAAFNRVGDAVQRVIEFLRNLRFPSLPSWATSVGGFGVTAAAASMGGGGTVVNVTINGPIDSDATARAIVDVLAKYDRRYGLVTP